MNEGPKGEDEQDPTRLVREVGTKAARKLRARRHAGRSVWFGLGMMGLIGWTVAVPTLLGAALGVWIDKRHPGGYSWTLMLLVIGLAVGCVTAWHWVALVGREVREEQDDDAS